MEDRLKAEILTFMISLVLGLFWTFYPGHARRLDRMSVFFTDPKMHEIWLRVFGLLLLGIAGAALIATTLDLIRR
jgi:hypothetical protein